MRILKNIPCVSETSNPTTMDAIAGEMLNIETSTHHFIDGVISDVPMSEYRGYPKIIDGTIQYTIEASTGYIFVPVGTNLDDFESKLYFPLQRLESEMVRRDNRPSTPLKNYHTIKSNFNTNIKIKSGQKIMQLTNPKPKQNYNRKQQKATNVLRQFVQDLDDSRRGRFTWIIKHIDKFEYEISSDNIEEATSRFACSVFWDGDDICTLEHNEITFEFSKQLLKGYKLLVNESVQLFKHGSPLMFELSSYWSSITNSTNAKSFLRDIPANRVYEIGRELLEFKPVKLNEIGDDTSTDVCSKCRSILWGPNYALAGNIKDPENTLCIAVCPLCLHSSPEDKPLESKYFRVFRTNFERTAEELLASPTISETKRDILKESLKGTVNQSIHTNGMTIDYLQVGDKYISFSNQDQFLYTDLVNREQFKNILVCKATSIE